MNMVCWVIVNGFFLDIISSDFLIIIKFVWFVYVLLWILLKYLVFGVMFVDVINVCIYILVVLMGMVVEIGMLVSGVFVDIVIFKLKNRYVEFVDIYGEMFMGMYVLVL